MEKKTTITRPLMTEFADVLDHGKEYRYVHDEPEAYAAGENYFPDQLTGTRYYQPVDRGLEIKIKEKLRHLQELDKSGK
jgi:putative ATPase